jgi:hypothetical protein
MMYELAGGQNLIILRKEEVENKLMSMSNGRGQLKTRASTPAGFEPALPKGNRFLICRRNHLAMASYYKPHLDEYIDGVTSRHDMRKQTTRVILGIKQQTRWQKKLHPKD